MSTIKTNIPEIAIFSEPNNDNSDAISLTNDVLTDTEELFDDQSVKKPKLRIKIPKDNDDDGATDVEDIETSDPECDYTNVVKHERPMTIKDLDFEIYTFEEFLTNNKDESARKQQSQIQTLELPQDIDATDAVLTDCEQFSTDSEVEVEHIPEMAVDLDEIPENSISISDHYKEKLPVNRFTENLTDCESIISENAGSLRKSKPRRRRNKNSNKQSNTGKRSLSIPLSSTCIDDSEDDRNNLGFDLCKSVVNSPQDVATDIEDIDDEPIITKPKRKQAIKSDDVPSDVSIEKQKLLNHKQNRIATIDSSTSGTEEESLEGYQDEHKIPDIHLPSPTRVLILLQENKSLIPTTKILPLDEHEIESLRIDENAGNQTDIECFKDNDDTHDINNDDYKRGPTPEILSYEITSIDCEDSKKETFKIIETDAVTDHEDLIVEKTKMSTGTDVDSSSSEIHYKTDVDNLDAEIEEISKHPNTTHTDSEELLADEDVGTMYLRGGSHLADDSDGDPAIFLNVKEGLVSFGIHKEWDVGKRATADKEPPAKAPETEQQGEEAGTSSGAHREPSPTLRAEAEESASGSQQQPEQTRPIVDQHQLSDEMKQLLKDLETESKQ